MTFGDFVRCSLIVFESYGDYESGWMRGLVQLVIGWRSVGFPVELASLVVRKGFDAGGFKPLADGVLL